MLFSLAQRYLSHFPGNEQGVWRAQAQKKVKGKEDSIFSCLHGRKIMEDLRVLSTKVILEQLFSKFTLHEEMKHWWPKITDCEPRA